ncbi:ATP-citrate lyase subunit A [Coccomyxa subellipsoidea C-169]|uniref:ATP citrate synthase n=1 Tax=Coccomyxa subellipsoidea (strain C-169) TaxID=574566 RepID=I0Z1U0_COCSC|nr:ATP-citrate lyase subunit A [Coccomyxa subellipsoidea C-169]EIE24609.1 ATP-citrate lyase subunit A [Coccomyxa subellipsoidea C-169]|eukprot:XP_005649153.1 ATP-citrate lyase subunit A [Coccomyxa subellipsoidea C-169]
MARKKIREYDSKRLLKAHILRLKGIKLPLNVAQVRADTNFVELLDANPWLKTTKLVVKPDMLFGKRGKHDLVGLNLDFPGVEAFIKARMGKVVDMDGCVGGINTFVVEPFVPHKQEYYLCIQSNRLGNDISFSEAGGVEIEENWDKVKKVTLAVEEEATNDSLAPLLSSLPLELRPDMETFIQACYEVFLDLDFTLMEMNPFTLDSEGKPFPLDMRGELDDTAAFKSGKKWGDLEFPLPFGRSMTAAEEYVHELDGKTGASLKLSILNPKGRIWTMVAGGGASVIYADTVGDLGYADELGNYAEYSGAPNTAETYAYAKTLLDVATSSADGRARALLVGGGIANFTDVAATFKGIIQAMREKADAIKAAEMRIFVRRGGPNYQAGLALMRQLGTDTGIPVEVFGPETSMTVICAKAIEYVKSSE